MTKADIPADILPLVSQIEQAATAYISALLFVVGDTERDPQFSDTHLFAYLLRDLLQSAHSIPILAAEGMWNIARRELRFLLESSTKQAAIQHQAYAISIQKKVTQFERLLESSSISCKNRLPLELLGKEMRPQFLEEIGRLYGEGSNYVHLSSLQVNNRMAAVKAGHSLAFESFEEAKAAADFATRTLAASIILLLHGVPIYVAGDLLVESDGTSRDWFFAQSKFIASMDAQFDYKNERQSVINEVRQKRQSVIKF